MTSHLQKVCDICHQRPATLHLCDGHTGETRDLCVTCFEHSASPEELESHRHFEEVMRTGKCQYCGAPAVCGSMSSVISGVKEEETHLVCEQCSQDLVEFTRHEEKVSPEDFDIEDETKMEKILEQLAERERRKEEFMRQRVKERSQ
jgi:protein-arginine kinase activator protein McsA